ncbi:DUF58 domain-containing protein [Dethiothermospora halolimnae]|uniref:DUF58 domain-containing protein n=1 Tax=Dethiothermospora halolimnae TaxID=3114390 RepID=UPI003CCBD372
MENIIVIIPIVIIIGIFSSKWDKWAPKKLEYKRYWDKDRVFVGDEIKMTTEITNRKFLMLPWIEVNTVVPKELNFKDQKVIEYNHNSNKIYKVVTSLLSFQRVRVHNTIYCDKRGYYELHEVNTSIGSYLGQVAKKRFLSPIKILVYPKVKPLKDMIIPYKNYQGDISVKRWIIPDPTLIAGAREYNSSDSFNTIDWKTTARMDKLYVKKFDFTGNPSVMAFLNVQTYESEIYGVKKEYIEKGIEIVAAIANEANKDKIPMGYTSNGLFAGNNQNIFLKPSSSRNQFNFILEALAKTNEYKRVGIAEEIKNKIKYINEGSVIVLVTAYLSENVKKEINYLSRKGYIVKLILLNDNTNIKGIHKNVEVLASNDKSLMEG